MAYCPNCEKNVQIVMKTDSSSYSVPIEKRSFRCDGNDRQYSNYIEESEEYVTETSSEPHCSNCFCKLEFPTATTKDEFEKAEREKFLELKEWKIMQLKGAINSSPPRLPELGYSRSRSSFLFEELAESTVPLFFLAGLPILAGSIPLFANEGNKKVGLFFFLGGIIIALIIVYYANEDSKKKFNSAVERYNHSLENKRIEMESHKRLQNEQQAKLQKLFLMEYSHKNYLDLKNEIRV